MSVTTRPDTSLGTVAEVVVAVAHQKGGVGKSTSAALLSAEIAELQPDWTVLVEDLDPYHHLTERWPGC